MNGFAVFTIVLTIGYVLYYIAMITMDLVSLSKSSENDEETVEASDKDAEDDGYVARAVVEDSDGGFSFTLPERVDMEQEIRMELDDIDEAEEQSVDDEELALSTDQVLLSEEVVADSVESPVHSDSLTVEDLEEDAIGEVMQPMEIEEEFNNISVCPFHEEQQEAAKVNDEPFDESTVFDPAMTTPRYDVATIVSPEMEASSVHKHCSEVNEALASIGTKSRHCFDSAGFHNLMHNRNNSEIHQIDVTENVTRF